MSLNPAEQELVHFATEIAPHLVVMLRKQVLQEAADRLDAHAARNEEGIHEYTDLLRSWADDEQRWKAGS